MDDNDAQLHKFIEHHKNLIYQEKRRLGFVDDVGIQNNEEELDSEYQCHSNSTDTELNEREENNQNFPLVEPLDLSSCNEKADKQAFINKIENSENPLTFRSHDSGESRMLRYGEYSPNNPQLRVATLPYLGLGEYEQRRQFINKQRQADYKDHISRTNESIKNKLNTYFSDVIPELSTPSGSYTRAVQTDIQNIRNKLVQYEFRSDNPAEKELSPQPVVEVEDNMYNHSPTFSRKNQSLPNSVVRPESHKLKSILSTRRSETSRDLQHSYVPSILDGFSYQDQKEYLEKEKLKREAYQRDLQQQIEEKKRFLAHKEEQERYEQELENRRLELQLQDLQDQQRMEQYKLPRNNLRRTSEDLKYYRDEQIDTQCRKHTESESGLTSLRNTKVASHYSPPISHRAPYSFNIPSSSVFANPSDRYNPFYNSCLSKDSLMQRRNYFSNRSESVNRNETRSRSNSTNRYESLQRQESLNRLDSLSAKDSLTRIPRRHSATQQDLSLLPTSPKLNRLDRSSTSKLNDILPIPVLKAHSPVAKDLKQSVVVDSSKQTSSNAMRRLEDRWKVPAVQKNIITPNDPFNEGQGRNILTQLGAIRLQLQREQLRMDETLQKRGISQSKAV